MVHVQRATSSADKSQHSATLPRPSRVVGQTERPSPNLNNSNHSRMPRTPPVRPKQTRTADSLSQSAILVYKMMGAARHWLPPGEAKQSRAADNLSQSPFSKLQARGRAALGRELR